MFEGMQFKNRMIKVKPKTTIVNLTLNSNQHYQIVASNKKYFIILKEDCMLQLLPRDLFSNMGVSYDAI
jgi:hypothetical protein